MTLWLQTYSSNLVNKEYNTVIRSYPTRIPELIIIPLFIGGRESERVEKSHPKFPMKKRKKERKKTKREKEKEKNNNYCMIINFYVEEGKGGKGGHKRVKKGSSIKIN